MELSAVQPAREKLRELRERAGLSLSEVGDGIGWGKSKYEYYESRFGKDLIPVELARLLAELYARRGIPKREVLSLAGMQLASDNSLMTATHPPPSGEPYSVADIKEVDVRAIRQADAIGDDGSVVGAWQIPSATVKVATNALPQHIKIMTIVGDTMCKTFNPYDRVMVDTSDRIPSPPGIFVVWEGLGASMRRVAHIPHSDPPIVRVSSDNEAYSPYERPLSEAHIVGRVLGRWQWV